jgi:hypothetical protein
MKILNLTHKGIKVLGRAENTGQHGYNLKRYAIIIGQVFKIIPAVFITLLRINAHHLSSENP